jgi:hypothetical protein
MIAVNYAQHLRAMYVRWTTQPQAVGSAVRVGFYMVREKVTSVRATTLCTNTIFVNAPIAE